MDENQYRCALYHHGIKGMHWGIRRSKDELGYGSNGTDKVAKAEKSVKMNGKYYESEKGFFADPRKLTSYCLDPMKKHSKEFFDDGYTQDDAEKLFRDIEKGFDLSKRGPDRVGKSGFVTYAIPMNLGVTRVREYTTAWADTGPVGKPVLVSVYYKNHGKRRKG